MSNEVQELLNDLFDEQAEKIKLYHSHNSIGNKNLLELYGLYKQSMNGDVIDNNNFRSFKEKKMWESWNSYKGKDKDECKHLFIKKVNNIMNN
tara:strand:+ start:1275 stop:1553 length:279 start_codon:yes stop_codon:yes gene_type:complete